MRANIDRRVVGENAILECKTAGEYMGKEWGINELPPSYYFQLMHYIAVLNLDRAYIAVQIGMSDFKFLTVERNDEVIEQLIEKEKQFWECVQTRMPPLPPVPLIEEKEEEIKLKPSLANRIRLLKDTQKHIKAMKQIEEEIKQEIKDNMHEYTKGLFEGLKLSYKTQTKETFNKNKFKEENPELYKKYACESSSRILKIK